MDRIAISPLENLLNEISPKKARSTKNTNALNYGKSRLTSATGPTLPSINHAGSKESPSKHMLPGRNFTMTESMPSVINTPKAPPPIGYESPFGRFNANYSQREIEPNHTPESQILVD